MSKYMTSWRAELADAMEMAEDAGPIIACTLDDEGLDEPFDSGWGGIQGEAFTAWTRGRVYFPVCYDGSEWVGSAPRHPCSETTKHQGGG